MHFCTASSYPSLPSDFVVGRIEKCVYTKGKMKWFPLHLYMCTHTCVSRRVISYKYVSGGWESRNILTAGVRHLSITDPCLDKDRFFFSISFFWRDKRGGHENWPSRRVIIVAGRRIFWCVCRCIIEKYWNTNQLMGGRKKGKKMRGRRQT